MNFTIQGLDDQHFAHLFQSDDQTLMSQGIRRMIVDKYPGFPCRVSLEDASVGEEVLLLPYLHHETTSPYKASGPIFVRKNAKQAKLGINCIPVMLTIRKLSLRAYDASGMMTEASVVEGKEIETAIQQFFNNPLTRYIQIHNAKPGCFNCTVNRI